MSLSEFLASIVRILEESDASYMLTGSLAAAYYAVPRATQDVDIVLEVEAKDIDRVVDGILRAGYYVDRDAAREAWHARGQFNAIDSRRGWKVDLIIRKDRPFSLEEFSRRGHGSVLGVNIFIASVEDVILSKLEWSQMGDSDQQRRDVLQLLERSGDTLDRAYIERWAKDLGVQTEWQVALARLVDPT